MVNIKVEKSKDALTLEKDMGISFDLKQAHSYDAGFDVRSAYPFQRILSYGETAVFPTGLFFELESPEWEIQVRSRSGMAAKNGVICLNSPGTIDYEYRGELGVILHNTSRKEYIVNPGDRIAQICVRRVPEVNIEYIEINKNTDRGSGGFGSTGVG